jgi:hypothetical protein
MTAPLDASTVASLEAQWAAAPKEWRDTYNGGTYPALPSMSVGLRRFTPGIAPGQQYEASPFTTVTGWTEVVGHYEYDQFTRDGRFVMHFSGDPSIGQFLSAAAIVAGGYAFGSAMASAGYGAAASAGIVDAAPTTGFVFNAAADSQVANIAINAAGGDALVGYTGYELTAASAPVWGSAAATAAPLTQAAVSIAQPVASTVAGVASTITKGVGAVASLLGLASSAARPGVTTQAYQPNQIPQSLTSSTVGGVPVAVILGGLALMALS